MPSYSNRVPFSLYPSAPSDAIRLPFESKNRPPPTICGTPVATLLTASGNVRNSMELFVPRHRAYLRAQVRRDHLGFLGEDVEEPPSHRTRTLQELLKKHDVSHTDCLYENIK
jgi:hypothetical protein